MVRNVAIIGAGSSGLTSIKSCVDEGLEPVCFESSDDVGGLWNFKETPEPGRSSIYHSLVTQTSKEIMCYSDFSMPADFPNYMHNSQLLQYLRLYAEHFDLLRYIKFQTTVKSVSQRPDFSLSGQWDIVTINSNGEEETHIFDAVLVCTGHFTNPNFPLTEFQGHETFSGRCLHSWEYKNVDAFRGKRVVVVGIGNSGGDVAVEISRSAKKTFLSTRQGAWVVGKTSTSGLPFDMVAFKRITFFLNKYLPKALLNWAVERALNNKYDHRLYGLKPKQRPVDKGFIYNNNLPGQILHGAIVMKHNLKGFKDSDVEFEDGTVEEKIDVVVFCTGYDGKFPFLPSTLLGVNEEVILYKTLFPPSLQHPTLAIIGHFIGRGPLFPVVELQARWAVRVFLGLSRLPSKEKMLAVIESERRSNMQSNPCPRKAALQIANIPYMDFLAEEIGARPKLLRLFLTDPVLWAKVFFGPCTPYQYRLSGPGNWPSARQAIFTQWERVVQPFRTREIPEETSRFVLFFPLLLIFAGSVIMAVLLS